MQSSLETLLHLISGCHMPLKWPQMAFLENIQDSCLVIWPTFYQTIWYCCNVWAHFWSHVLSKQPKWHFQKISQMAVVECDYMNKHWAFEYSAYKHSRVIAQFSYPRVTKLGYSGHTCWPRKPIFAVACGQSHDHFTLKVWTSCMQAFQSYSLVYLTLHPGESLDQPGKWPSVRPDHFPVQFSSLGTPQVGGW